MNTITIPPSLETAFGVAEPTTICDEKGRVLGYYTPLREATDEEYAWLMKEVTSEEIEASLKSGPGRPLSDILADLHRKYGP
jgi:hypothetical protein